MRSFIPRFVIGALFLHFGHVVMWTDVTDKIRAYISKYSFTVVRCCFIPCRFLNNEIKYNCTFILSIPSLHCTQCRCSFFHRITLHIPCRLESHHQYTIQSNTTFFIQVHQSYSTNTHFRFVHHSTSMSHHKTHNSNASFFSRPASISIKPIALQFTPVYYSSSFRLIQKHSLQSKNEPKYKNLHWLKRIFLFSSCINFTATNWVTFCPSILLFFFSFHRKPCSTDQVRTKIAAFTLKK